MRPNQAAEFFPQICWNQCDLKQIHMTELDPSLHEHSPRVNDQEIFHFLIQDWVLGPFKIMTLGDPNHAHIKPLAFARLVQ